MTKKTIFCIAGMHRSGTSLFANWLHQSGVFLGYDLYGAASSNPKGHFEDLDFLELHKEDLRLKGIHESGLFVDKGDLYFDKIVLNRANELIAKRYDLDVWGWKDPRSTLYINQWKELLPELKVIVIRREKSQVLNSLYARLKKNKWYYTRNPIKRLVWYLDIDLRPGKWKNVFGRTDDVYQESIKNFKDRYPDQILELDLDQMVNSPKEASKEVEEFLGLSRGLVSFEHVYTQKLLHNLK